MEHSEPHVPLTPSIHFSPRPLSVSLRYDLSFAASPHVPSDFFSVSGPSVSFILAWCAGWRCCCGHLSLSGPSGCSCGPAGSCGPSLWSYRWLLGSPFDPWAGCTWTAQWRAASRRLSGPRAMPRGSVRDPWSEMRSVSGVDNGSGSSGCA